MWPRCQARVRFCRLRGAIVDALGQEELVSHLLDAKGLPDCRLYVIQGTAWRSWLGSMFCIFGGVRGVRSAAL